MRLGDPTLATLARALDGDADALGTLAHAPERIKGHRIASALAARARAVGVELPAAWQQTRYRAAAHHLLLDAALSGAARELERAGVSFAPIKGSDLAHRIYASPDERPSGDVDLLIDAAGFEAARQGLLDAGWRAVTDDPLTERYLRDEGYAWQATGRDDVLLELHVRLWGMVPEALGASLLNEASDAPDIASTARRLTLAGAFVLAAVHTWLEPPPRPMLRWWELERLCAHGEKTEHDLVTPVLELCERFDLSFPVGLACRVSATLWPRNETLITLASRLEESYAWSERRVLAHADRSGIERTPLGSIVLARLLAGRDSRAGWRSVWRRLWPHPAIVARATPNTWTWPRRRAASLWQG
ncbi:MAG: nucleotidyltransferase family protein, partial [Acidobacteriota bacterium]